MYLAYYDNDYSAKNKLEKAIIEYLKSIDRTVVQDEDFKEFTNNVISKIKEICIENKRCKPKKPYFWKDQKFELYLHTYRIKEISVKLDYLDYITISCAYQYFKRHMRREWDKFSAESIRRKRKTKTKNELRRNLQSIFYSQYILRSGIYHANQVKERSGSEITDTEWEHFNKLQEIQGGQYRTQVEKETLKIE